MPLSRHAIDKLKAVYRKHYGEELADEAAFEMGNRLLRVFGVLMRLPTVPAAENEKGSHPVAFD